MADIEKSIYSILSGDAGVTALVSTRIYPLIVPQDVSLPAVQYQNISKTVYYTHDGEAAERSRIQVSAIDSTYQGARALADAIQAALSGYRGTVTGGRIFSCFMDGERDGIALLNDLEMVQQDYLIMHGG